jgi:hypothetical protein
MADTPKTVIIGDKWYHLPFADLIPFDPEQDAALGREIAEAGEVLVPVIANKGKSTGRQVWVTDGAHRVLHCARLRLDPPPVRYRRFEDEAEELDFVLRVNLHRRHLSPQQLEQERQKRIERVAELRRRGESLRAIAEAEGVSHEQVRRDLQDAVVTGVTTEPPGGQITTKDGKKRDAKAVICKRCKRMHSPVKNCRQCERARKAAATRKAAKKKARADAEQKVDCFKNPVPPKRCDALFDPWIQDAIDFLAQASEAFRMERLMELMNKKQKHYPFVNAQDFIDGCGFVIQYLDQLIEHLKENRPAAVCPACAGQGCGACRMSGLVPRTIFQQPKESKT